MTFKSLGTFSGFQNLLSKNKKHLILLYLTTIELNEPQDKCLMDIAF